MIGRPLRIHASRGAGIGVALVLVLAACGEEDAGATGTPALLPSLTATASLVPSAEPSVEATATTTATASPEPTSASAGINGDMPPDVDRIMDHIEHLAVAIGSRPAGTAEEREAARYIAGVLREAGYAIAIEEFEFTTDIEASWVTLSSGTRFSAVAMEGSPSAEAMGEIAFAGLGRPEDIAGVDLDGRVAVFDRGVTTFTDMVAAAQEAGAVAVVVVNNEDGPFRGTLGNVDAEIPVVSVESRHGGTLKVGTGRWLTVHAEYGPRTVESQNVVATRGDCRAYLGAHYDSVPQGPGANDNASGTALIMEMARVNARPGLCVIAFGSEEVGLFGSQAYVQEHFTGTARLMFNVDMAGRLDGPVIVGDDDLTGEILAALTRAEVGGRFRAGEFPPFASSDHVSFEAVGIPSVTFNSGDDDEIHTAADSIERIQVEAVAVFAHALDVALDALLP